MAKYKPQHIRLLFIDRKIREGSYPNCSSLADEWEVSAKTIQRDLDYMRYQLDAPIAYSGGKRGFFYTEKQYHLPAMSIRQQDLFGMYLAEKLLIQYEGTPVYESLCSVFQKIEQSLPERAAFDPVVDQAKFTVIPPFSTSIDPKVWETCVACLRKSQRLQISYKRPGKKVGKRQIEPYHCVRIEGDWYIIGFCHLRQGIRTFSLARITAASTIKKHFTIPEDFDYKQLSSSHFGVHWGKERIRVTIYFDPKVADFIQERSWHPSQQITVRGDGALILALTVSHLLELKRWILSWGPMAKVLQPQEFADAIREECQQMLHSYQEQGLCLGQRKRT